MSAVDPGPLPWWRRALRPPGAVPVVAAVLFFWASLTPSLLPRPTLLQGAVGGAAAAIGWGLAVLLLAVTRWMLERPVDWVPGPRGRLLLLAVAVGGTLLMLWHQAGWQHELRVLMGMPDVGPGHYVLVLLLAAVVLAVLVLAARGLQAVVRRVARRARRYVPPRVAAVVAVTLVLLLTVGILDGVVLDRARATLDTTFSTINSETHADTDPPALPELSGGPGSLVGWDSLGRTGREFVRDATTVEELEEFAGRPAQQPIRAYVGLDGGRSLAEQAELAVAELERAGAFERAVILLVTPTGTGWLNENAIAPVEYLAHGDSAAVGMQYSYLPSALALLADQDRARESGRQLFNAVYARVAELPPSQQPRLLVNGESLGSFGGESAFSGIDDLRIRTDGALFVGPPFMNDLWGELTANRDEGSPQWLPVYQEGETVRFVARPSDLQRPDTPWGPTRVVYLQHASDPISWWSPRLAFTRPDWLEEERGYDVLPQTRWFPFVTFLQVAADMAASEAVPPGHGHRFGTDPAEAWAAILEPERWTAQDTDRLRATLEAQDVDDVEEE